ncbi:MAG: aldo/keto reductase [Myxococcota bacterium]
METRTIPGLEEEASRIGLGTWAIGGWMWGGTDEDLSVRTIHAALDKGINLVDTAPVYGQGRSEEIVGRALKEWSGGGRVLVATKAGLDWSGEGITRDSSPERLRKEVEDSLRRLQVDAIDLYQVHWPDGAVPFEETARTLEALRREGKIRAVGVSNFSPEQMAAFRKGGPLHTCQPPYNLFERQAEDEILPWCRAQGVATLTYGALCRGLLTGKMSEDTTFEGDDLRKVDPKFQPPRFRQYLAAVDALDRFARERHERSVLELAVRWLLEQPGVSVALWGARKPEQVDPVERVMGWSLSSDDLGEIDRIVAEHVTDPVGPEFMAPPESG